MNPLLTRPATELLRLVAAGDVSAADLVRAHLDRIAIADPGLGAFVDVDADRALAEARRQDEHAARGEPRGPLGGLPVTVKSAIDRAGLRCEAGSASRRGVIAASDAVVVSRLRGAGAIVLGTTNVAEMLMAYESDNPVHGRTRNPWDLARTAGGSSGGEAAAIASGCSAGGVGSDGGGSIRVPAHFSGICGLKPTPGRIPTTGHQPPCLGPFSLIGVVGPMARTVGDLQVLDRVMAGGDEGAPASVPDAGRGQGSVPRGLGVAWFEDDGAGAVTPETRAAVRRAAAALAASGFVIEARRPAALDRAAALWEVFFVEAGRLLLHQALGGAEDDLPILRAWLDRREPRRELTAERLIDAWVQRDLLCASLADEMRAWPILLCPVAAVPAFRHGERVWDIEGRVVGYLEAMRYTQWFNVLGNPAAVVPAGRSADGLPIGVQIVGRPGDDALVLDVAAVVERECGGYRPPPDVAGGA